MPGLAHGFNHERFASNLSVSGAGMCVYMVCVCVFTLSSYHRCCHCLQPYLLQPRDCSYSPIFPVLSHACRKHCLKGKADRIQDKVFLYDHRMCIALRPVCCSHHLTAKRGESLALATEEPNWNLQRGKFHINGLRVERKVNGEFLKTFFST
ncbi:UNVERIFIED_CONTAM: hypothetical protein K2H54_020085 [Gekko kuhli]